MKSMYEEKGDIYFSGARKILLDLIPEDIRGGSMLEIGAGDGMNLLYAKEQGYANKVYGCELMKIPGSCQDSDEFEEFIYGNIETIPLNYKKNQFDVIFMGDVIEHLVNPYETVEKLKAFLKPNGVFISSIPNARNLKLFRNLFLRGTFKYYDEGIFDRTHLRFFAKQNIKELFENAGYEVMTMISDLKYKSCTVAKKNKMAFGLFEEFLTTQYYTVAKK